MFASPLSISFAEKGLDSNVGTQSKIDSYENRWTGIENRRKGDGYSQRGSSPNVPRN
jgi:hypothetical protein